MFLGCFVFCFCWSFCVKLIHSLHDHRRVPAAVEGHGAVAVIANPGRYPPLGHLSVAQLLVMTVVNITAHTVVATPDGRTMVMPFANPALGKAGSGDVLAGAIVGLRAQGVAPFEAAIAGAYLHGLAGELARDNLGAIAVVAGDLVGYLVMASQMVRGRRKFL